MQPTITINSNSLSVKEYKGQRVVTFRDVDSVHGRPPGTARKRFNDNRKHFIEGEDYHKVSSSEFRTAIGDMDKRQQNNVTLLTETGYLMLVKSFTDELAWKVQRELVNCYFKAKATPAAVPERQLELHEYIDKTYQGEPVMSTADVAFFLEISSSMVAFIARKHLTLNEDYLYLDSRALAAYKAANPSVSRMASTVMLFKSSGFRKICQYFGKTVESPATFCSDHEIIPSNSMEKLMGYVHRETKAIEGLAHLLTCRGKEKDHEFYRKQLVRHIRDLRCYCPDIETILIR